MEYLLSQLKEKVLWPNNHTIGELIEPSMPSLKAD